MEEIPFLAEYGDWVAWSTVALLLWYTLWHRPIDRVRKDRAARGRPDGESIAREDELQEGRVAVEGVLRFPGKDKAWAARAFVDDVDLIEETDAVLEHPQGMIRIDGPVRLSAGDTEIQRPLPRFLARMGFSADPRTNVVSLRTCKDGSPVVMCGDLQRKATAKAGDYRSDAAAWSFTSEKPVRVFATTRKYRHQGVAIRVGGTLLWGLILAGSMYAGGAIAEEARFEGAGFMTLGAISPFHREEAFRSFSRRVRDQIENDGRYDLIPSWMRSEQNAGYCGMRPFQELRTTLALESHLGDAPDECSADELWQEAHGHYVALGRFQEASDVLVRYDDSRHAIEHEERARVHLLAGELERAHASVDRLRAILVAEAESPPPGSDSSFYELRAARVICAAELLNELRGGPVSRNIPERHREVPECSLVHSILSDVELDEAARSFVQGYELSANFGFCFAYERNCARAINSATCQATLSMPNWPLDGELPTPACDSFLERSDESLATLPANHQYAFARLFVTEGRSRFLIGDREAGRALSERGVRLLANLFDAMEVAAEVPGTVDPRELAAMTREYNLAQRELAIMHAREEDYALARRLLSDWPRSADDFVRNTLIALDPEAPTSELTASRRLRNATLQSVSEGRFDVLFDEPDSYRPQASEYYWLSAFAPRLNTDERDRAAETLRIESNWINFQVSTVFWARRVAEWYPLVETFLPDDAARVREIIAAYQEGVQDPRIRVLIAVLDS